MRWANKLFKIHSIRHKDLPQITKWAESINSNIGKRNRGKDKDSMPNEIMAVKSSTDDEAEVEAYLVKEELIRQRNWLSSKLKNMKHNNKMLEAQKKSVQSENLKLIGECNTLRDENNAIVKKVQMLEKKFKDVWGIDWSKDTGELNNQIENFLKRASTLTTKHKDTPYVAMKKQVGKHNRNNLLATYYKQFSKEPKIQQNMTMGVPLQRNVGISTIIGDLARNKNALHNQNLELQILRDQVGKFQLNQDMPRMIKSGSQPSLTSDKLNDLDDDLYGDYNAIGQNQKLPSLNLSKSSKSRQEL